MFEETIHDLQQRLRSSACSETRQWREAYVLDGAPFIGVAMPKIRSILHQWYGQEVEKKFQLEEQVDLAVALVERVYTEEKLAGTVFLQEKLLPAFSLALSSERNLDRFAELFDRGKLYDWNTCDWFCIKVLGPLIEVGGLEYAGRISAWCSAQNLWRARASVVVFVRLVGQCEYYPAIESACATLVRRSERFAQTAVGWMVRDIAKHDVAWAQRFVGEQIQHFSAEALGRAIKHFSHEGLKNGNAVRQEMKK